ncbi:MAG TPA: hypothetical protein VGK67_34220 [Myxococcales bacterium]|jgi:predicted transcriptional regulator of viral defense system
MTSRDEVESRPVFTHEELVAEYVSAGRSRRSADSLLHKHLAAGRVVRVKRGVFLPVPRGVSADAAPYDPYLVATKLAPNAAVAYHAALQFHGKSYSQSRRFHFFTRERLRPTSFRGTEFVPVRLPAPFEGQADMGGGILERRHAGGVVRVATLERTLVDVFDAPDRGGGWEEIWRSLEMVEFFDLDAVIDYVGRLGSAIACARVGFFLEQHREPLMVEERHLAALQAHAPKGPRYLDPKRVPGKLVGRWNLIVPARVLERSWQEVT